jgi:hypothetical protein
MMMTFSTRSQGSSIFKGANNMPIGRLLIARLIAGSLLLMPVATSAEPVTVTVLGVTITFGSATAAAATVVSGTVILWLGIGILVWYGMTPAPPPPPGAEPKCASCEADRLKWDRMSIFEKILALVLYEAKQAVCALQGCGWRLW